MYKFTQNIYAHIYVNKIYLNIFWCV